MADETILIVEDEGLIALQMTEVLEKEGYRVYGPFCSGSDAISVLDEGSNIDLILMDITLAGTLDGIETAQKIQQRISCPLIFVTAHTSEKMLSRMNEVEHAGILFKPFIGEDMVKFVNVTIGRSVS